MKTNNDLHMVLIDFDGVVSKNAVKILLSMSHRALNELTPMPFEAMRMGFINSSCQPPVFSAKQTFDTLGLDEVQLRQYFVELVKVNDFNGETIKIEDDFFPFISFCKENNIAIKIFSTGSVDLKRFEPVVEKLGKDAFYDLNNQYKSKPQTYKDVAEFLGVNLDKILHIDDSPLALRASKICGLQTIMMLNEIFDESQYEIYKDFIDYKVTSFDQVKDYIIKTYDVE